MNFDNNFVLRLARKIREFQKKVWTKQESNCDLTVPQIMAASLSDALVRSGRHSGVTTQMFADDFQLYAILMTYLCAREDRLSLPESSETKPEAESTCYRVEDDNGLYFHFKHDGREHSFEARAAHRRSRMRRPDLCDPWTGGETPRWIPKSLRYSLMLAPEHWKYRKSYHLPALATRMLWNIYCNEDPRANVWCSPAGIYEYILSELVKHGIVRSSGDGTWSIVHTEVLDDCRSYDYLRSEVGVEGAYAKQILLCKSQNRDQAVFEAGVRRLSEKGLL